MVVVAQSPTLDGAQAFSVTKGEGRQTVVAGPVDDAAADVIVELADETTVPAQLTAAREPTGL